MIYRYATHNVGNMQDDFTGFYGSGSNIKIVMRSRSKTAHVSLYNKALDKYTRISFQCVNGKITPIHGNGINETTRKQLETFTRNYVSVDERGFLKIDGRKFQTKIWYK